jgi:mitochondrial-processing peptidase subunit alpha
MLFMNLEQRPVQFEDIARQVMSRGKREQAKYYFEQIKSVTEQDVRRVAQKMLSTKVAVAALGNINSKDVYERVQNHIHAKNSIKSKLKKNLFRV